MYESTIIRELSNTNNRILLSGSYQLFYQHFYQPDNLYPFIHNNSVSDYTYDNKFTLGYTASFRIILILELNQYIDEQGAYNDGLNN